MPDAPEPPPSELEGLDAGELLARGLKTVHPTGDGRWHPLEAEEVARLLPQFQVERMLGRGGMGAVYKGVQVSLDRPVAIKLLPAEMAADQNFVARFLREAKTLARLHHSNIVAIYESGQTAEGHLYFVMEYVDGTDLRHVLRGPGLKIEQALTLVSQICEALQAAHRQGVMHRDIKPENVLLTTDGEVKLADFGLARPVYEEEDFLTGTNVTVGTPAYMAPEQHEGQSDHRTDIYALGVMLYEMLTGKPPRGVIEAPSHRVQVDVRIDEVVMRALQAQPDRRYQSVVEMKTDVDRIRTSAAAAKHGPPPPASRAGPAKEPAAASPAPPRKKRLVRVALIAIGLLVALDLLSIFVRPKSLSWRFTNPNVYEGGTPSRPEAEQTPAPPAPASKSTSPPILSAEATSKDTLKAATKEKPFVNSLGLSFVPVPGTNVLFCTTLTRLQDYRTYVAAVPREQVSRQGGSFSPTRIINQGAWDETGYVQEDDFPVVNVTWYDAKSFCAWLSKRDGVKYRLPTDHEWSIAIGIGHLEDPNEDPMAKSDRLPLWGWAGENGSNVPPNVGNVGDLTSREATGSGGDRYRDGYVTASPVTRFAATSLGLYDMFGNASQWCEDWADQSKSTKVARGSNWRIMSYHASVRKPYPPTTAMCDRGFRCVIELSPNPPGSAESLTRARPGPVEPAPTKTAASPPPVVAPAPKITEATKEKPYVNSLGMSFVPVPGTKTLFCTTPTRVQDFRPFAKQYPPERLFHEPPHESANGYLNGGSWENPNYEQQEDFPVVNVSWNDAKAWCAWLSAREKLRYRLPTDHEWSIAVGLGDLEDPNELPAAKSDQSKRQEWGDGPPPERFGNVSDRTMQEKYPLTYGMAQTDGYANASPVTAFRPSALGLYDMSGNVNQWCEDWADGKKNSKVRRGNNWVMRLWPASHRDNWPAMKGAINSGFRCVIELGETPVLEVK